MMCHWQNSIEIICNEEKICSWLNYKNSMTVALNQLTQNQLMIEILAEKFVDQDWQRETLLLAADKPLMYAISRFPENTYSICKPQLNHLGQKSLGATLIDQESFSKRKFVFAKIKTDDKNLKVFLPFHSERKTAYLRQSTLSIQQQPFILTEYFLPPLLDWITDSPQIP